MRHTLRRGSTVGFAFLLQLLLSGYSSFEIDGCEKPVDPVDTSRITIDPSCDPHRNTVEQAIAYVVRHEGRMDYHGDLVVKVLAGDGPPLTIACEPLTAADGKALFGLSTYWPSTRKARIKLNPSTALSKLWYTDMLGMLDMTVDSQVFFAAGILAHEVTHTVDYHYLASECSIEYNPDLNEYGMWTIADKLDQAIACYDTTRRGCEDGDNHTTDFMSCLRDRVFY